MITLKIAKPDKKVFEGECSRVTIKTIAGVVTILPGHVPLVSIIENGYVTIDQKEPIEIESGYVSVCEDSKIDILIMK